MYRLNHKIEQLKPYTPVTGHFQIHLDANESFLSPPASVWEELEGEWGKLCLNRYPDPSARELCEAFGKHYNVPLENIVAGNGSDELISVIFGAFLEKGEAFATVEPDFSMYALNGFLQEGRHVSVGKQEDFTLDIDKLIETCHNENIRLLVLSNPCNPTSIVCSRKEIRKLLQNVEALVVIDEAYMDFSDQSLLSEFQQYDNLILLRTCSKALGLAALRLGFAVACQRLASALRAAKAPYNVNALSQKLGALILNQGQALEDAKKEILHSRDHLLSGLAQIAGRYPGRFRLLPSETNFASLVMPDGERLLAFLAEQGIAVRHTGGILRITCGKPEENDLLLKELAVYFQI